MSSRLIFILLLTGTVGCGSETAPVAVSEQVTTLFGGVQAIEAVQSPTVVRAYRLASPSFFQKSLTEYETTGVPVTVADTLTTDLQKLLLQDGSYDWDVAKGCMPDYGVRLQFVQGETSVDVLLCFECEIMGVYLNGEVVGGEDFDSINSQLVDIAKKLFPDDKAVQSLG